MKRRIYLISLLFFCGGLLVVTRLYGLQVGERFARSTQATKQYGNGYFLPGKRGALYDRHGRELALTFRGKRVYPHGQLAAHLLGFVGRDGQGLEGIEYFFDGPLRNKGSRIEVLRDGRGKRLYSPEGAKDSWEVDGKDITLTLDEVVQHIAEEELAAQVVRQQAKGGVAVVLDPFSGEILALAIYPSFDPNAYLKSNPRAWRNRAITDSLEPGSTFKIIPLAAALEEGLTSLDEQIDGEEGTLSLSRQIILRDIPPHDRLSLEEVITQSSNIGTIKVSRRLGKERLYRYVRLFGFGSKTGVDLPGEAAGLVSPPQKWSKVSLEFLAIGQEIGVTPLQLATAYAVIANGGLWVKPRIVKTFGPPQKPEGKMAPPIGRRVLAPTTCRQLTRALIRVVSGGTGTRAALEGFEVAGKTGTAQKMGPYQHSSEQRYMSSFVGFVPARHPQAVILVMIDEPQGVHLGGAVAAPVFREIAQRAMRYWQRKAMHPEIGQKV